MDMGNVPGPCLLVLECQERMQDARCSLKSLPNALLRPIIPMFKKLPCLPTGQQVKSKFTIWAQVASQLLPICSQTPTSRSQQAHLRGPWLHTGSCLCTITYISPVCSPHALTNPTQFSATGSPVTNPIRTLHSSLSPQ